jgi:hypothetical protein
VVTAEVSSARGLNGVAIASRLLPP